MTKSLKAVLSVLFVVALVGCYSDYSKTVSTSDGSRAVKYYSSPQEFCYKGIAYVKFGSGQSSWGTLRLDRAGNVVTCGENNEIN